MTLLNSLLNFKDRYELPCGFEVPLLKSHVQVGFPVGRVTLPPYEQLVPAVVALLSKVCAGLDGTHSARNGKHKVEALGTQTPHSVTTSATESKWSYLLITGGTTTRVRGHALQPCQTPSRGKVEVRRTETLSPSLTTQPASCEANPPSATSLLCCTTRHRVVGEAGVVTRRVGASGVGGSACRMLPVRLLAPAAARAALVHTG